MRRMNMANFTSKLTGRRPKLTAARCRALTALLAVLQVSAGWAKSSPADNGHYSSTDATVYSFIDLTVVGGSASVLAHTDDGMALLTMPFPFAFYGKSYTLLCASANGIAYFVTSAAACSSITDFQNVDLTANPAPGDLPAVAPFWTDLSFQTAGAGAVYYQTQGAVGSRKFVVQWNNAYPQAPSPSSNPVTFEMVLYESSNQVLFQYKTVNLGSGNPATKGAQATVGIRDSAGNSNGRETPWSYDASVLNDASAILFSPGYTWLGSSQITATTSAFAFNRGTGLYTGTVTLKNIGTSAVAGPFQVLLVGLPAGVTLSNAAGTYAGSPYLTVASPASLGAGQSVTVNLQFTDPSNVGINFRTAVYEGSLQ